MFNFVKKLQYYPEKSKAFRSGEYEKTLSTVLLYLSSGICNHDCVYCDKHFYDIKTASFDFSFLKNLINDMRELNADSLIMLGEGGEPLLHPAFCDFVNFAVENDIACGIYTNGSVYNAEIVNALKRMDFVRISLDAGSVQTHVKIHKYPQTRNDFENALKILEDLAGSTVSTGASFIIMDDNIHEIYSTWCLMSKLGVGFLELKLPLEDGYVFSRLSDDKLKQIKTQTELIKSNQTIDSTKLVLNNHLRILIDGMVTDASELTRQDELPCMTCAFRVIVSPLGYFQCSPRKNTSAACFGDPFQTRLKDAWTSEQHKSMIGAPCNICCTYSEQNVVLNRMTSGENFPLPMQDSPVTQTKFL